MKILLIAGVLSVVSVSANSSEWHTVTKADVKGSIILAAKNSAKHHKMYSMCKQDSGTYGATFESSFLREQKEVFFKKRDALNYVEPKLVDFIVGARNSGARAGVKGYRDSYNVNCSNEFDLSVAYYENLIRYVNISLDQKFFRIDDVINRFVGTGEKCGESIALGKSKRSSDKKSVEGEAVCLRWSYDYSLIAAYLEDDRHEKLPKVEARAFLDATIKGLSFVTGKKVD